MSALAELGELAWSRPTEVWAPREVVAAWYERKSLVLHRVAAEAVTATERADLTACAERAHAHATRLRRATSP